MMLIIIKQSRLLLIKCLNHYIELIITGKTQSLKVIYNLFYGNPPSFGTATIFKIQLLSTLGVKCWGKFRVFQFALAICQQKYCQKLSRSDCISSWQQLQHTSEFCQELWFDFLAVGTTSSTNIILSTYNTLKRGKQKTIFLPMITLF